MHAKKTNKTKLAVVLLALALLVGCAAGATLAWLKVETAPIVNTFTVGDINITLTETDAIKDTDKLEKSFKMVPGDTITKDPTVTVEANSEACYLFVKVVKSENFDKFMSYEMVTDWKELTEGSGVYYREVVKADAAAGKSFPVLKDNQVHVLETVTKDMMDDITAGEEEKPTLTFTAYAVQSANVADAAAAWSIATTPTTP